MIRHRRTWAGLANAAEPAVSDEVPAPAVPERAGATRITRRCMRGSTSGRAARAVPESARGVGFGGVGFLVDTVLGKAREGGWWTGGPRGQPPPDRRLGQVPDRCHPADRRAGALADPRLRRDAKPGGCTPTGRSPTPPGRCRATSRTCLTRPGCSRTSWAAARRSRSTADGRGYRVVVRKPEPLPTGVELFMDPGRPPCWRFGNGGSSVGWRVVDAESGRLLRLTLYKGGRPVLRQELRDVADLDGPGDFGFTPPAGLPVEEKTEDEDRPPRPDGAHPSSADAVNLGDAARIAADAVKKQVDEKVAAARGFLESFLGGRR